MPEPEEGLISPARAAALVSVGSVLGLTAVAAVRWLNGGDFELFPPPAREAKEGTHRSFQAGQTLNQRQESKDYEGGERFHQLGRERPVAPNTILSPDAKENDRLSEHVQTLVEALHSNTQQQEKILQKFSARSDNGSITNQSMNLLRPRDDCPENSLAVFRKLAEVQAELSSLRRDVVGLRDATTGVDSTKWEGRLSETMEDLRTCLDQLEPQKSSTEAAATRETKTNGTNKTVEVEEATPDESSHQHRSSTDLTAFDSSTSESSLADAIRQLAGENDATTLREGTQLLYLYVVNLSNNPRAPRYRKIYTSNESFLKVDRLVGGRELLTAVGFVDQGNCLEWLPSDSTSKEENDDEDMYMLLLKKAASVLSVLKSSPQEPGQDSEALALAALSALTPDRRIRAETPPPPVPPTTITQMEPFENSVPSTPEIGSIVSPPATKKILSSPSFPPVHPLSKNFDDALTCFSDDSVVGDKFSPLAEDRRLNIDKRKNQDGDGVDAMWK